MAVEVRDPARLVLPAHLVDFLLHPLLVIVEESTEEIPPLYGFSQPIQDHRTREILLRSIWHDGARIHIHPHAWSGRLAHGYLNMQS